MLNKEDVFIPFSTDDLSEGPWLIFSPHADDETYGMGGTLIQAASNGIEIHLVVLTDGALGGSDSDLVAVREEEVKRIALVLGVATLDCWKEPDRSLRLDTALVARVLNKIKDIAPAAVFFPGPMEPHPDHRNTALLVWSALQNLAVVERPIAYSYEISVQNPINVLVDTSKQRQEKSNLMRVYSSQNSQNNYEDLVRALDKGRTFSLPNEIDCAEGFYRYSEKQLESSLAETLACLIDRYLRH
jgi:LmbE family N-acetylglucosaminyl deacetylase